MGIPLDEFKEIIAAEMAEGASEEDANLIAVIQAVVEEKGALEDELGTEVEDTESNAAKVARLVSLENYIQNLTAIVEASE